MEDDGSTVADSVLVPGEQGMLASGTSKAEVGNSCGKELGPLTSTHSAGP
mgnify:CR=1 FL=1